MDLLKLIPFKREIEREKIGQLLGWTIIRNHKGNLLQKTTYGQIIQTKQGPEIQITTIPELTIEEAQLINHVTKEFSEIIQLEDVTDIKQELGQLLKEHCQYNLILLDAEQETYLTKILNDTITGYGPIDSLMQDQEIEEIAVTGIQKPVRVYHVNYGWSTTNLILENEEYITDIINKMARHIGRSLTYQKPCLDASLPDGTRINATSSTITQTGITLTIRKIKTSPLTPIDLANLGSITIQALAYLWKTLKTDTNIIVCGNTGSGKTTLLNSLLTFLPINERIVITEETPEINTPHKHKIKLNVNPTLGITMQKLVENTLRMRPDRVIVGEIRTEEEAKAYINTILAGQGKGSYATYHAQKTKDVITRLKRQGIDYKDLENINLIILQKRWTQNNKEIRKVIEISELKPTKDEPQLIPIFKYDYKQRKLKRTKNKSLIMQEIRKTNNITNKKLDNELKNKQKHLEKIIKQKISIDQFLEYCAGFP